MSVTAQIVVLFRERPAGGRIDEIARLSGISRLEVLDEADLYAWVSPEGELEYRSDPRSAPLMGESTLEGRLFFAYLGRYWTPEDPGYGGNPVAYRKTLAELMHCSDVQYVWYGAELTDEAGCSGTLPMTESRLAAYFS